MKRLVSWLWRATRKYFRPRRRKVGVSIVAVILILVGVIVHYLDAPAEGHTIPATDAAKVVKATTKPPASPAQQLTNDFFSLSLPPGYNVQSHQPTPSNLLFNQMITKPGGFGTLIIAISIANMPSDGLDGDTSYTFRAQQPSVYQMSTKNYGGDTVHIASDSQTSSVVAFWPHGSYLATVSISSGTDAPSGDGNQDELNSLQPLLAAWQWQ